MSGILKLTNTILSGTTNDNLLTGSKFDYLGNDAVVTIYQIQDIVAGSSISTDFTLGNVVVGDDLVCNSIPAGAATAGQGPRTNEDVLAQGAGKAGDRITVRVRETTGIATADGIIRTQIVIQDV